MSERRAQVQVTFDCADPGALSTFWAEVLGYALDATAPGLRHLGRVPRDARRPGGPAQQRVAPAATRTGVGPRLFFQQVPEGKTAKNRVHLDVRAAPAWRATSGWRPSRPSASGSSALGATRLQRLEPAPPMSAGFIVMQDPEGNEFCLD